MIRYILFSFLILILGCDAKPLIPLSNKDTTSIIVNNFHVKKLPFPKDGYIIIDAEKTIYDIANNYNLLWAFPLSLFLALLIAKANPKRWLQRYVIFLLLMLILLGFHWVTGVQVFALSLLPLFIGMLVRYFYLSGYLRKENS